MAVKSPKANQNSCSVKIASASEKFETTIIMNPRFQLSTVSRSKIEKVKSYSNSPTSIYRGSTLDCEYWSLVKQHQSETFGSSLQTLEFNMGTLSWESVAF